MKKLFPLLMAVQISAFAFASREVVPSDAVLANYYNQGEVCLCFFVPEELNCCSIVVTGSFNSWSSTIAECATVRSVTGYDGWYVSSFVPEAQPSEWGGIQAKPIMLDANGNFNWEYQVGAVTIIRGGVQVTAGGVSGEISLVNYGTDAPNVFAVDAWKQNPCTAIYHNYKITVISDGCNNYAVPFIVGVMTNWDFEQMTLDNNKTQANQAATYTYSFRAAEGLQYQIVSGLWDPTTGAMDPNAMPGWEDEAYMQKLVNGEWVRIPGDDGDNFLTNANANIVYDLRTETLRWARCAGSIDPVSPDRVEIGGLYYILDDANHTAEVTSQIDGRPYWLAEITMANIPSSVAYANVTYRVTRIGDHAFHYCDSLTSVTIPNSVTSIGEEAFYRCIALTSITIPNSVTSIGDRAFWCSTGFTSIAIPSSVTSIGAGTFRACSGLTSMTIPNTVTSIGESAFRECYNLISVTIPNSVTSMGESAFRDCFQLTSITVPSSVTSISAYAFSGCSHMTSVTIPNSITSIGERAFDGCRRLTSITCKAPNPPALGDNVFMSVDKSIPLYVPAESVNAYRAADQWNEFTNIQGANFDPDPNPDPNPNPNPDPVVNDYNVIYQISDGFQLYAETVTLHLPVAPQITGFSFLKWQVVGGDLENGIKIQAVYVATTENTPEVVINPANRAQKLIRNGQVYILKGGKTYTITGQKIK